MENIAMLDLLERLRAKPTLQALLAHYAGLAVNGREMWQDRLMTLDEVDVRDLSRLHGELIAFDWLEQNSGRFGALRPGAVTGCYRVTNAGLRALARLQATQDEDEKDALESQETDLASAEPPTIAAPPPESAELPAVDNAPLEVDRAA
jgi:hypothetical protein